MRVHVFKAILKHYQSVFDAILNITEECVIVTLKKSSKSIISQTYFNLKGTVRPDWICMRVVPLESPLKGPQPLYVFDFLISVLNI
jgi:hypothetical protein